MRNRVWLEWPLCGEGESDGGAGTDGCVDAGEGEAGKDAGGRA